MEEDSANSSVPLCEDGPQCRICFDGGSDGEQGPLSLYRVAAP